ncbi:TFIIIC transcription initiation factor [Neofusicoccum parvum]|nr:TFIIIC transcription initiation factor [Neofusicoccum parvum]
MPEAEDGSANPEVPISRKKGKWLGGKKQGVKLSGGGILNFNRTKLLVSIVEKCDGVFPGDFEIHRPFVGLWNKEYGAERQVDRDTIKRTIKNAIDSRKLHRFAYSFKNKNGVMMTRHILSLPSVAQNDQLVLDTQKKVISAWPRVYTPPQMKEYEEEVGNSWYGDKYEKDTSVRVERSNLPKWMRDMELRTAENQRKREEEKSRKQEREAKGEALLVQSSLAVLDVNVLLVFRDLQQIRMILPGPLSSQSSLGLLMFRTMKISRSQPHFLVLDPTAI